MRKLAFVGALALGAINMFAAATPPDTSGIVDDGATVAYAALGIGIVITTAVIAIRAARKWVK